MARLDPLERLERVLEDINTGISDALGNEGIPMDQRLIVNEAAVSMLEHCSEVIDVIRPFYEEPPEE